MKKTLALGLLVLLFLPAGACDNMQKKLTADYDQRFIDTIIAHYQSGIEAAGLA